MAPRATRRLCFRFYFVTEAVISVVGDYALRFPFCTLRRSENGGETAVSGTESGGRRRGRGGGRAYRGSRPSGGSLSRNTLARCFWTPSGDSSSSGRFLNSTSRSSSD